MFEEHPTPVISQLDCSTRKFLRMPGSHLATVEQGEHQPVDQKRPKLLHEIKGEGRLARANPVQETDVRIQANLGAAGGTGGSAD